MFTYEDIDDINGFPYINTPLLADLDAYYEAYNTFLKPMVDNEEHKFSHTEIEKLVEYVDEKMKKLDPTDPVHEILLDINHKRDRHN